MDLMGVDQCSRRQDPEDTAVDKGDPGDPQEGEK